MPSASRNAMAWLRALAGAVLVLMLGAALYSGWITIANYGRIGV